MSADSEAVLNLTEGLRHHGEPAALLGARLGCQALGYLLGMGRARGGHDCRQVGSRHVGTGGHRGAQRRKMEIVVTALTTLNLSSVYTC